MVLLLLTGSSLCAGAQQTSGTIVYERKADMRKKATDNKLPPGLPPLLSSRHQLLFTDSTAIYLSAEEEEERPDPFDNSPNRPVIRRVGMNDVCFKNFNTQLAVQQKELLNKVYLIQDTLQQPPWKIETDTLSVLGHACKKAVMQGRNNQTIVAWFTEDIPVPAGPEMFGGLPGMILHVNINNGEMIITALSISNKTDVKRIQPPRKGEQVSQQVYEQKMKELMNNAAPGPGFIRMRMN
jgi:GLPGLI family protein